MIRAEKPARETAASLRSCLTAAIVLTVLLGSPARAAQLPQAAAFDPKVHDAMVDGIAQPRLQVDTLPFEPVAHIRNSGDIDERLIPVYFRICDDLGQEVFYSDSLTVSLAAHQGMSVTFRLWNGNHPPGPYLAVCSTALARDTNHANDTLSKAFTVVRPVGPDGWFRLSSVPLGPQNKPVWAGGALACTEQGDSLFVWALKGNNTNEFYRWEAEFSETWQEMESLPLVSASTKLKKRVKAGGALAAGGDGRIYAVKGNRSNEFWQYDPHAVPGTPHWIEKSPVPIADGVLRRGVGMTALSLDSNRYIYLLRGGLTREFYRYDIARNLWERMADARTAKSRAGFGAGSALACAPVRKLIYALNGRRGAFFVYRPGDDTWLSLPPLPLVGWGGRPRRSGDGAALAFSQDHVYALKGNNTGELWSYDTLWSTWIEVSEMPDYYGRKVKAGGALGAISTGNRVFALNGNRTSVFRCYFLEADRATAGAPQAVAGALSAGVLSVAPNPLTGAAGINFSVPKPGNVSLRLYGADGRLVKVLLEGPRDAGMFSVGLDAAPLPRGVYLIRLDCPGFTQTRKLVLAR